MGKKFKRAKSKENKQLRMNEIMEATEFLFENKTYHEITLTAISKELGMARGNLYKYVMSKEEIFLQIYLKKQKQTIEMILSTLQKENTITIPILSKIISQSFEKNLDYIKYHQIMNAIVETNVSIEKLADFKINSYRDREPLYENIVTVCHLESTQEASDLYLMILYHSCYLYDRVAYHDAYVKAMQMARLPIISIDFQKSFYQFIIMCLTYYYK